MCLKVLDEIRMLANFVELENKLKNTSKAQRKFAEMLKDNVVPYYSAYYSDYMGDDINELKIVIIDDKGEQYECPQEVSKRYACTHVKPYEESGMGITDFIIQLIKDGIVPERFKVVERVHEEINREDIYEDYNEYEGYITLEHFEIIKQHLIKQLQQ